jgi:hypothetical protein
MIAAEAPGKTPALPGYGELKQWEFVRVMQALAQGQGGAFTEQQAQVAADWANEARVTAACLDMVLRGRLGVRVDDAGELLLCCPDQAGGH